MMGRIYAFLRHPFMRQVTTEVAGRVIGSLDELGRWALTYAAALAEDGVSAEERKKIRKEFNAFKKALLK